MHRLLLDLRASGYWQRIGIEQRAVNADAIEDKGFHAKGLQRPCVLTSNSAQT